MAASASIQQTCTGSPTPYLLSSRYVKHYLVGVDICAQRLQLRVTWLAHRSSQHVLSVKISNEVAIGHAQLPQAVLQSLKLRHHGRLRLQSVTLATHVQPSTITLHPMPCNPDSINTKPSATTQQATVTEELSQQDLKQLLAAWLAAQASILGTRDQEEHVPVQQCTVVQLTAGSNAATEQQQSMAFKLYMKQPPSLRADPLASYALLTAADLAPSSRLSVSHGGPVVAAQEWVVPPPASVQLHEQQAAMLSSSEALHTAASCALKHLLPLLAFSCRYQPAACQAHSFALLLEALQHVHSSDLLPESADQASCLLLTLSRSLPAKAAFGLSPVMPSSCLFCFLC